MITPLITILSLGMIVSPANGAGSGCQYGLYDFERLAEVVWDVYAGKQSTSSTTQFKIQFCQPLSADLNCGQNTSICRLNGNGTSLNIGTFVPPREGLMKEDAVTKEIVLELEGDTCDQSSELNMTSVVAFKCGKTLGSPELLASDMCKTYFEWETSVVCKSAATVKPAVESKCYVYNSQKLKIDLDPLIKVSDRPYRVKSDDDDDEGAALFINVCREIPEAMDSSCLGSAACLHTGSKYISLGRPQRSQPLSLTDDGELSLVYKDDFKQPGCSLPSSTKIIFKCPKEGKDSAPRLLSSSDCQYLVTWDTEAACPEQGLVNSSCQIIQPQHNIHIDLSPLAGTVFNMTVNTPGQENYVYSLNVCGDEGVPYCSANKNSSSCQLFIDGSRQPKSLGDINHQTLRYLDGHLDLIYTDGDACSSGYHRSTIISFHCNSTIGVGVPHFSAENNCSYLFEWETSLACVSRSAMTCQIEGDDGRQLYDLSALTVTEGSADWTVDGFDPPNHVIINVCRNLVLFDNDTSSCSPDAAVCLIAHHVNNTSSAKSLGRLAGSLYLDKTTHSIKMSYTDGDVCQNDVKYSVNVTFRCSPGSVMTRPSLESSTACHYNLVWYTASACLRGHKWGQDCHVDDLDAGYSFDLRALALKPSVEGKAYYLVPSNKSNHDYYVNVCERVSGTPCDDRTQSMSVCQQDRINTQLKHNCGTTNRTLHYFDNLLTLVYEEGDPYSIKPPVARRTEILFPCDEDAGRGQPQFEGESNRTYRFIWYTSYACPFTRVDCSVTDEKTGLRYDLSRLSHSPSEENWSAYLSLPLNAKLKFYFNICRPVVPVQLLGGSTDDSVCDARASICATELLDGRETVKYKNLGHMVKSPEIQSDGSLLLEYVEGDMCEDEVKNKKSTVKLLLFCSNTQANGPSYVVRDGPCAYTITWRTVYACPYNASLAGAACNVTDPVTDYTYDMTELSLNSSYRVNVSTTAFWKMNICGTATGCQDGASVCDENNKTVVNASVARIHLSAGQLQLVYEDKAMAAGRSSVVIRFHCSKTSSSSSPPQFSGQSDDSYMFDMRTPLACPPPSVECQTLDSQGNKFDLSPLTSPDDVWAVTDGRNRYVFNVCRAVNHGTVTERCPGGPVGGCQITSDGQKSSLGYVTRPPYVAADGSLNLVYEGGDVCSGSEAQGNATRRSLHIVFSCAPVQHEPVLQVTLSKMCEHVIQWATPYACPLRHAVGENCSVTDPLYHIQFDLSPLRKSDGSNYQISTAVGNFTLNLCGALQGSGFKGDCAENDAGACWLTGDTFINIGTYNERLEYVEGELQLIYMTSDTKTNVTQSHVTTVILTCDQTPGSVQGGLKYLASRSNNYQHWFQYSTPLACAPFSLSDCSLTDNKGLSYDLSGLTSFSDNYESDGNDGGTEYILNVCTSLVHSKGVACPPNSAACLVHRNETDPMKRYKSIGQLIGRVLTLDNDNNLVLTYSSGDKCSGTRLSSTHIRFVCSHSTNVGKPQYLLTDSGCVHSFVWLTSQACPANNSAVHQDSNCTTTDPAGNQYNIRSLAGTYSMKDTDDHSFNLSLCVPLKDSPCGILSGNCQKADKDGRFFNAGNVSTALTYRAGILSLIYPGGQVCGHTHQPRTTFVNFYCPASPSQAGEGVMQPPTVMEDDQCTYFVSFYTELACPLKLQCKAHSDKGDVDLSSLIRSDGFYPAIVNLTEKNDQYFVSVCSPLLSVTQSGPQSDLTSRCHPSAAICQRTSDDTFISLGRLSGEPVVDPVSRSVLISYHNGSTCQTASGGVTQHWSSQITFTCQLGRTQSLPEYIRTEACVVYFEWRTSIVCTSESVSDVTTRHDDVIIPQPGGGGAKDQPPFGSSCKFENVKQQYVYDFTELASLVPSVTVKSKLAPSGEYHLSVCGAMVTGPCQGGSLCMVRNKTVVWSMSSSSVSPRVLFEADSIKLVYTSFSCDTNTKSGYATVIFQCDRTAPLTNSPALLQETADGCVAVFVWHTQFACPPVQTSKCWVSDSAVDKVLTSLTSKYREWKYKDDLNQELRVSLCSGLHPSDGWAGCHNDAAVCRKKAGSSTAEPIGLVNTQQILFNKSSSVNPIVLQYFNTRQGQESCYTSIVLVCDSERPGTDYLRKSKSHSAEGVISQCVVQLELVTSAVCRLTGSSNTKEEVASTQSSTHSKAGLVAGVVLLVCALAILTTVVLWSPRRRNAIRNRLKDVFVRNSSSSHGYTSLSTGDSSESARLLHSLSPSILQNYDSDDDILL